MLQSLPFDRSGPEGLSQHPYVMLPRNRELHLRPFSYIAILHHSRCTAPLLRIHVNTRAEHCQVAASSLAPKDNHRDVPFFEAELSGKHGSNLP